MKRLKYACPFGGKHYPFLTALAVGTAVLFTCIFNAATLSGFLVIFYPLLAAAVVLAGCFWWEHRLTRDEERLSVQGPVAALAEKEHLSVANKGQCPDKAVDPVFDQIL